MSQVDLVVATGSQNNIRAAYSSGTPAVGVGQGNVAVIVDETADCSLAAEKIVASKCFDHATSCSSENSVIVVDGAYDQFCEALVHQGAVINLFGLGAQVFYQFDLLGHHFSRYPQTQHGQGIGHLAQTWEQVLKLTVLAQL